MPTVGPSRILRGTSSSIGPSSNPSRPCERGGRPTGDRPPRRRDRRGRPGAPRQSSWLPAKCSVWGPWTMKMPALTRRWRAAAVSPACPACRRVNTWRWRAAERDEEPIGVVHGEEAWRGGATPVPALRRQAGDITPGAMSRASFRTRPARSRRRRAAGRRTRPARSGRHGSRQGDQVWRSTVIAASASSSTSTPRPGPVGTRRWPSCSSNGAVRSRA